MLKKKKKGCFVVVQYANNWHGFLVHGTCLDLLGICLLPVVWRTLKIQEDSKGALRKLCYGGKHNRGALGSFKFQTSANLLFSLPQIMNPTVNILNHRPLALEGAKAALPDPLFWTQPCLPVLVNLPDVWPQHRCRRCISSLLFWSKVQPWWFTPKASLQGQGDKTPSGSPLTASCLRGSVVPMCIGPGFCPFSEVEGRIKKTESMRGLYDRRLTLTSEEDMTGSSV